jgi:hypothetical protein
MIIGPIVEVTIPLGADGSNLDAVDLGRRYESVMIMSEDSSGLAAGTTMKLRVSPRESIDPLPLYELNSPNTEYSKALPDSANGFAVVVTHLTGSRYVKPILSAVTDAAVTLKFMGVGRVNLGA